MLIEVSNITKVHKNPDTSQVTAFEDFSFSIQSGEFISLFGPNGCGKSTLLNILAGFTKADGGSIKKIDGLRYSYVFQNYRESLFPWMTVWENITYPLKVKGVKKEERYKKAQGFCQRFNLSLPLTAYPYFLSGGQQQMVCLLRAFITIPDIVFMDEPFSALDYQTSIVVSDLLQKLWLESKPSIILVSHDIDQALLLSQKLVVLSKKPAKVIMEIKNEMPYPRSIKETTTESFIKSKNKALEAFSLSFQFEPDITATINN